LNFQSRYEMLLQYIFTIDIQLNVRMYNLVLIGDKIFLFTYKHHIVVVIVVIIKVFDGI